MNGKPARAARFAATAALAACAGCTSLSALLGAAGSLVESQVEDFQTRTFAHPVDAVRPVIITRLLALGMTIRSVDGVGREQRVVASSAEREISVDLEPVAPGSTWVRVIAREGLNVDRASARWVLREAGEALGDPDVAARRGTEFAAPDE